jgi:hypothetical protein
MVRKDIKAILEGFERKDKSTEADAKYKITKSIGSVAHKLTTKEPVIKVQFKVI